MKPFQNASKPTVRIELKGILSEFREALEEEIDKIEKSGQSSTLLFSGRQIESHGADFWYRFNVEYAPVLPADTPCKLVVGKDFFDVTVISFEESSVVVSSKVTLPETIGKARLENGATVLMKRLIKCIEENSKKENPAGNRMLSTDDRVYAAKKIFNYGDLALKNSNTDSQNNAIRSALTNDITYIWGPPGTGKTTVIGQIVDELYKHNRSVLVVSHTNTAVDGAIEKADETYFETTSSSDVAYPILRMGIPTKKSLPERVLLEHH
ncbi:MAG: AAA family ATPase, partial [Oscillospiraceae bacterium]|nr:AAA family ATPase [Oscillospiraceae bacterium]